MLNNKQKVLLNILLSIIMSFFMSMLMTLLKVGISEHTVPEFFISWGLGILVTTPVSLVLPDLLVKIVKRFFLETEIK